MLTLPLTVEGNDSGDTLVFLQGWPDDASLWNESVDALRARYRCVRTTLPNHGGDRTARWGYTTREIVDAVVRYVEAAGRGGPVTLILHDWGCYWGHSAHHERPDLVARVASFDVAPHVRPTPRAAAGIIAYQTWLLGAFALGGRTGDVMTRLMARGAHAPGAPANITAWMNYPYRNFWRDMFSGDARKLTRGYWPTCPLLFVYGENKPFMFHDAHWTDHVRKVGGDVVGLPCGHWVQRDPRFVETLRGWLETSAKEARPTGAAHS